MRVARGAKLTNPCEMKLAARGAAVCLSLLLALVATACSSDNKASDAQGPAGEQDIGQVIYVGEPTDEALLRLLDSTAMADPHHALTLDSPDVTAPVPKDAPVTFAFHVAASAQSTPTMQRALGQPGRFAWRRGLHEFLQLIAPVRIAHAHGAPYNGTAYYLVVSDRDSKPVLQVFTSETSFTPEAVDFQHLVDAPQPLTLEITFADFEDNRIPSGGGPFQGGKFQFRIE